MTITKDVFLDRALIVFNRDGTIRGAQQSSLEVMTDNGVELPERDTGAIPLTAKAFAKLLPDNANTLSQLAVALAERDALLLYIQNNMTEK